MTQAIRNPLKLKVSSRGTQRDGAMAGPLRVSVSHYASPVNPSAFVAKRVSPSMFETK